MQSNENAYGQNIFGTIVAMNNSDVNLYIK